MDWKEVNQCLRVHGLPAIHPTQCKQNKSGVLFNLETALLIQENLISLMKDLDKTQELTQHLFDTNNSLRKELKDETTTSDSYSNKIDTLETRLKEAKYSGDGQLGSVLQQEGERIQASNAHIQAHCQTLAERCKNQQEQLETLRDQLHKISLEDERRMLRQTKVFKDIRQKSLSASNDRIVSMIDSYERQIHQLKKQLARCRPNDSTNHDNVCHREDYMSFTDQDFKTYERQLRAARKVIESLENQNDLLRLDVDNRPTLRDHRRAQQKIQKLQRALANTKLMDKGTEHSAKKEEASHSTHIDDIQYLTLKQCHSYLRIFCEDLELHNINDAINKVQRLNVISEAYTTLEKFTGDTLTIVSSPGALKPDNVDIPERSHTSKPHRHTVWCDKSLNHVIPILKHWYQELDKLQGLHQCIEQLCSVWLPWLQLTPPTQISITTITAQLTDIIDKKHYTQPLENAKLTTKQSRQSLQSCINHFMLLFDVKTLDGVYARMNDLYNKLGESHNVLNTIRSTLGLELHCRTSLIIEAVDRLCSAHHSNLTMEIKQLLDVPDLHSVTRKLAEHAEFFPMFELMTRELLKVLDVKRIDQIVPTVRAIKVLAAGSK